MNISLISLLIFVFAIPYNLAFGKLFSLTEELLSSHHVLAAADVANTSLETESVFWSVCVGSWLESQQTHCTHGRQSGGNGICRGSLFFVCLNFSAPRLPRTFLCPLTGSYNTAEKWQLLPYSCQTLSLHSVHQLSSVLISMGNKDCVFTAPSLL